ncbi:unnamed protein product [Nesidiocoris tenuis]|uniref:RNA-directed DNA polymerase n=1 Tax=Nesidiocoris tenuis TaxID=355587 RepID=A0A6H5H7Z7_9HEMI|nr:unnamed protein product [Nesidiocoris tenuis]
MKNKHTLISTIMKMKPEEPVQNFVSTQNEQGNRIPISSCSWHGRRSQCRGHRHPKTPQCRSSRPISSKNGPLCSKWFKNKGVVARFHVLSNTEGEKTPTTIFICKGVKDLLIDRTTLQALRVIHHDFPQPLTESKVNKNIASISELSENPTVEEINKIKQNLLEEYKDVFDTTTLKPMKCKKVHIELKEKVVPFAITCPRKIPIPWKDQVKQELDGLVEKGIIKPSSEEASDFVSPLVVIPKHNGKIRICVDFTKLNNYVKRPVHPFKAPWEAVSNIGNGNIYFSSLDAASGYFQMELDEQSQKLTTFLTPWGRYQFLQAPMGLIRSGDEFCRRGDEALSGITYIDNIQKVVDDILVYDKNFENHYIRIRQILERCRTSSITLNKDKFIFAQSELPYVGYTVGKDGIKADPKKIEAILKFRAPKNLTELRSFMGIEKTKRRARQTVFWPAISSDIQNIVEACKLCQERRPSIQKEPLMNDPLPDRPFVDVSMDLFSTGGKNFMVYVDRLSGWPIIVQFGTRCPNSATVINSQRRIFSDTGIPIRIRCDGGPQFSSLEFKEFLRKWKINKSPSSPHFPQSNGHAEAAVKVMKSLISKCTKNGVLDEEEYHAGLLEFRNTPTSTGYSPSQLLMGRPLRSLVPAHRRSFSRNWLDAANQIDRDHQRNLVAEQFNKNAKNLNPLDVGTNVRVQNPSTKKWDMTGIIVDRGE